MILSPHFALSELIVSNTGLPNMPDSFQLNSLVNLCTNILEPIRAHFNLPVIVNSGFRSADVNKAVGGVPTSQHAKGEAADIHIPGVNNSDLWQYIVDSLPFDQVIAEKLSKTNGQAGWVHVSYVTNGRRDAISFLGNGVYVHGLEFVS